MVTKQPESVSIIDFLGALSFPFSRLNQFELRRDDPASYEPAADGERHHGLGVDTRIRIHGRDLEHDQVGLSQRGTRQRVLEQSRLNQAPAFEKRESGHSARVDGDQNHCRTLVRILATAPDGCFTRVWSPLVVITEPFQSGFFPSTMAIRVFFIFLATEHLQSSPSGHFSLW